jgi:hypothetical protein
MLWKEGLAVKNANKALKKGLPKWFRNKSK